MKKTLPYHSKTSKILLPAFLTLLAAWLMCTTSNAQFGASPWTATNGTYTVPAGVCTITVQAWGGGGGGGGAKGSSTNGTFAEAGGGGGGAFSLTTVTVVPGQTITVAVGGGGAQGTNSTNGGAGVASTVTYNSVTVASAAGGSGGVKSNELGTASGGTGGSTGTGTLHNGGNGGSGWQSYGGGGGGGGGGTTGNGSAGLSSSPGTGGAGGAGSPTGGVGGAGGTSSGNAAVNGTGGTIPGGGGGGAVSTNNSTAKVGGLGAAGQIIIAYVSTPPPTGGTITGPSAICSPQLGTSYSITGVSGTVTTYTWTVPTGASITSGAGTATITVNWSASAASGNVTCTPTNGSCLETPVTYPVTVTATPAIPTGSVANNCGNSVITITNAVGGATFSWSDGGTDNPHTVTVANTYSVTQSINGCQSGVANFSVSPVQNVPDPVTVSGGGSFCDHELLTASGGTNGTIYFQGTTSGGTSTATPTSAQTVTASGTYYFNANNVCGWGIEGSTTVNINPLPSSVSVTGGGTVCQSATLNASGGIGGTMYWQNTISGGTSTSTPSTSQTVTAVGTYYFRALSDSGCWGPEGSATVNNVVNNVPTPVTVNGGGSFCSVPITLNATGGTNGTIYYQGTTSGGTSTVTPSTSQTVSSSGTYYFNANNVCGWGTEGSATVVENPLPGSVSVSGAGTFCQTTTITASGGSGGTIYFQGTTSGGTSTTTSSTSQIITSSGTYYFRAQTALGCWGPEGSAVVVIQQPVGLSGTPSPANGAASVALSSTLSWTAAANATGYNVYFGTTSPPPLVSTNQAGLTYNPGTLISNTTYYWHIDPQNSCGFISGAALAFTTTIQQYTTSTIFTVPAGITSIKVQAWGGGGAGGGVSSSLSTLGGGGGGGGGYSNATWTVTPTNTYTVTVGAGGTGSSGNNGSSGNASTITGAAGTISAAGGTFGIRNNGAGGNGGAGNAFAGGAGGAGGTNGGGGGGGAGNLGNGVNGTANGTAAGGSGSPAIAVGGNGGASQSNAAAGNNGTAPGGGGGGAKTIITSSASRAGGNGGGGQALISWTPSLTLASNAQPASYVCPSSTNVIIHSFALTGINNGGNLTGFSFVTTGNYTAVEISNFKLFWTTTNSFATTNPLGTIAAPVAAGTQSFPAFSQMFGNGTFYFWITMDVPSTIIDGHTLAVNATVGGNFTTNTGSLTYPGSSAASGTQTLSKPLAPTGAASQSFCINSNPAVANLSATGPSIKWYDNPTGGILYSSSTALIDGNHYYASQSFGACESATRLDVTVTLNQNPTLSPTSTNVLCFGGANGTAAAGAANGTAPYNYSWSNGATTSTISGLSIGTYTVTISDANGCGAVSSAITINQPSALSAAAVNTSPACEGDTIRLNPSLAGGTMPYSYSWSGPNGYSYSGNPGIIENPVLANNGVYSLTVTDANGCTISATTTVTVNHCITILNLNLMIEGYYLGSSLMNSTMLNEGVIGATGNQTDSIMIDLYDYPGTYATPHESQPAMLMTNGSATGIFSPSITGGTYYIAVRHRNAIQTWTANPVVFSQTTAYNFTTAQTQAYGNNQVLVDAGLWAFYNGDINQDGNVDLIDFPPLDFGINHGLFGYYASDLNGDGNVDLLDFPMLDANINSGIFMQKP